MTDCDLEKIDAKKEVKVMLSRKAWTMKMLAAKAFRCQREILFPAKFELQAFSE